MDHFVILPLHKLFIDHLKVLDKFVTSDLDLDLQGQICHESLNVCAIVRHLFFANAKKGPP